MNGSLTFPGGSKSKVNMAGEHVRNGTATEEDLSIIEEWREAHRHVLNTFQAIFRSKKKTASYPITIAQRHKRKNTIFGKMIRFPRMQLSRMDDVAGCRLIFQNISDLDHFRNEILCSKRMKHRIKNELDKYDYIKSPKKTGYRGIHDVYSYAVNSKGGKHRAGLLVEVQYRTAVQHAWATAVEIVGSITENQPKFQQGDQRYQHAMALSSEILARHHEGKKGAFPHLSDKKLVKEFHEVDLELSLIKQLSALSPAQENISRRSNSILIFSEDGSLEIKTFKLATEALTNLFMLEKEHPEKDIVLVKTDDSNEIKYAFKNYFHDSSDFLGLLNEAIVGLAGQTLNSLTLNKLKR